MTNRTLINKYVFAVLSLLLLISSVANSQVKSTASNSFEGHLFPKATGWVNDYVNMFTRPQKDTLTNMVEAFDKETTDQIAIVVTDDPAITVDNFEKYFTALHNYWGVGTKEKNNGVLICIVPRLRKMRISNGTGIEQYMSTDETLEIINDVIAPDFKKGNFYLGVKNGVTAIMDKLK